MGNVVKLLGTGLKTGQFYDNILAADQIAMLEASPELTPFDGNARHFRIGIEALRLGLAYEYDPYFALSIARIDPLPHQLEAVYDYFLAQPRIRFLLADDPGAGKTIMAGLPFQELQLPGAGKRPLIRTPAKLALPWHRRVEKQIHQKLGNVGGQVVG